MCGLCGFVARDIDGTTRERLTSALLEAIDHRGGDATGTLAITKDGHPSLVKAPLKAPAFNKGRPALPRETQAVIGHTRLATQGSTAWTWNNHPVRVGDTYLAHNGHVWNQMALGRLLPREPLASVDSALLAGMADKFGPLAVLDEWQQVEGAAAVVYWSAAHPAQIVLARIDGSPLHVWQGRRAIVWASTPQAIAEAWKRAANGKPGKIRALAEGEALIVSLDGSTVETRRFARPHRRHWTPSYRSGWSQDDLTREWGRAAATKPQKAPQTPLKAAPAPTPVKAAPRTAVNGGQTGADLWLPTRKVLGIGRCENCDEWTETHEVAIGGVTFQLCEGCEDHAWTLL